MSSATGGTATATAIVGARAVQPILRWPGGKRWLVAPIRSIANLAGMGDYVEPFVGGAAVFLGSHWKRAVIGDSSKNLIACYRGLASNLSAVRQQLARLHMNKQTYYELSRSEPLTDVEAAVRMLYLNRGAFGGMYRENALGQFNVPYSGDRNISTVLAGDRLETVSAALSSALIVEQDFESTIKGATPGSIIYCDPPYSRPGGEQEFRRYTQTPFNWESQIRLSEAVRDAANRGCLAIVSNSGHDDLLPVFGRDRVVLSRRSNLGNGAPDRREAIYVISRDRILTELAVTALRRSTTSL